MLRVHASITPLLPFPAAMSILHPLLTPFITEKLEGAKAAASFSHFSTLVLLKIQKSPWERDSGLVVGFPFLPVLG